MGTRKSFLTAGFWIVPKMGAWAGPHVTLESQTRLGRVLLEREGPRKHGKSEITKEEHDVSLILPMLAININWFKVQGTTITVMACNVSLSPLILSSRLLHRYVGLSNSVPPSLSLTSSKSLSLYKYIYTGSTKEVIQ